MARIALGSNVKEGPRRGKVVGHRPKGMVDVQFEDVEWVERRPESNLRKGNPAPDTYDPTMEQWRRQVLGIYKSERERGSTPFQAKKDAFRIAGGVTYRDGRRKKGKMKATAKGRRDAKAKLETPDAWRKRQEWEMFLAMGRKSGKHRVVPQRHGRQTRYYVQPGGRYFHGKGAKKRAESLRDELNGVSMPKRMKMAANPKTSKGDVAWLKYTLHMDEADMTGMAFEDIGSNKMKVYETYNVPEYMAMFSTPKIMTKAKARECWSRLVQQDDGYGNRVWVPRRQNWLPAAAAALTIADVGYRAVRDRKKKTKKEKENPRYLDERGGMRRGLAEVRREARNRLSQARTLGTQKGHLLVELSRVPRSERAKFRKERADIERKIDSIDHMFHILKGQVQDEISLDYYGRLSKDQRLGIAELRIVYAGAAKEIIDADKRKKAARKARRAKANPKMYAGISGLGYYWASVRSMKPGEYIPPMILTDRDPQTGKVVYYFVFESKNKRRVSVLQRAAKAAGLRGTSMRSELEGAYKQRKRGQEPLYIFKTGSLKRAQDLAIDLQGRNIGYKVDPPNLFGKLARKSVPKRARKPTGLEQKTMAELVARREELLAKRAKKKANPAQDVITRKADLKRDEHYTLWLKMPSGGYVIVRSYPGGYIRDAMWDDIKAYNKANTRQHVVVPYGIDPNDAGYYRKNFVGSLVRGGVALAKTKMGKAIIAETAVVAAVMIGDKLVQKGKVSPKVMTYIQGRVEQKTGVKPSKAEVTKVLSAMDKNKDKTLTDDEVIEALELMQKRKKK